MFSRDVESAERSAMPPNLSYAHGTSDQPLLGQTIGDNLRTTVARHGERDAFVFRAQHVRLTYREFWDLTTKCARALLALGVVAGDRVGIWSPNRFEWPVVQYATARIGAILINVNPSFKAGELEFVLRQSGTSVLFKAAGFRGIDYRAVFDSVRERLSGVQSVINIDGQWDDFLNRGASVTDNELQARERSLSFDDPINIQYTSGTTGLPKGATLTHHNILNNGWFVGEAIRLTERDRVCVPVPFYHCFGMVLGNLACTSHGACVVVASESFDARAVLEAIQAERCTALYGVPTMFISVLDCPTFPQTDVSSLRTGIMAGAACPIELMRRVVRDLHMPEVAIGYGMTEMSPIATMTAHDDPLERRVGSVGRVFPHVEAKIVDPVTHATVARGTAGEFCARGYSIMRGYWDDSAATNQARDSASWMHSGDLAVMDDAGYVYIVGRIKDIIIRGGENISPREIEEVLLTHPAVRDAHVIGIPSAKYGEEVMAWVNLRSGCSAACEELSHFCCQRIAGYKVPRQWKFVDEFPLTVTGKVQKFRMREIAAAELESGT
jgi:fatty-acyl-CoA synthase